MSKFKLIEGTNVVSLVGSEREIRVLEREILAKRGGVTDRDLVIYAHHFVRLGNFLLAQKYLNKLSTSYFDREVFVDLSHALLVWSMLKVSPDLVPPGLAKIHEYFIILKQATRSFDELNFASKPAFVRFKKQFHKFTAVPSA